MLRIVMGKSVIPRSSTSEQKIVRAKYSPGVREQNEVLAAHQQVDHFSHSETKRFYAGIYDFYQSNEC